MNKVGIVQSSYLPWKGYFDLIHDVDCFIFLDNVQMTTRDWRNRNKIKTPQGMCWMTIPVGEHHHQQIDAIKINDFRWQKEHYKMLMHHYAKAPFLKKYKNWLEEIFLKTQWEHLSTLNQTLTREIARELLNIKTIYINAGDLKTVGTKTDRLISILKAVEGTHYISGPSAKAYIEEDKFDDANIELQYKNYQGYPEYKQFYPPFEHQVSIMDLLFHTGDKAPDYIWNWR